MDDVLIIGGGPAGLAAALYLARYRRGVRVVDDGRSRALLAPRAHNVPGFPRGVVGRELVSGMRDHAERYGAVVSAGRVSQLSRSEGEGFFEAVLETGERIIVRGIILATGVEMRTVRLDQGNHDDAVRAGVLRYCPICDGFEQRGSRIAVLGSGLHGAAEAMFLRQYSQDVTLIPVQRVGLTPRQRADLAASEVTVLERKVAAIHHIAGAIELQLEGEAEPRLFDILYPALGSVPRTQLVAQLGIATDADGSLAAGAFSEPLLPGMFAAGDLLSGLDQISGAAGQGAMAATRLHNWLREREHHVMTDQLADR